MNRGRTVRDTPSTMALRPLVLLALLSVTSLGCGLAKKRECTAIIQQINEDDEALKKVDFKEKDPRKLAAAVREAMGIESKVANDLDRATFKVAEVRQAGSDYSRFSRDLSTGLGELATRVDQVADLTDAADATKPTSAVSKSTAAMNRFGDHCRLHPSGSCLRVATELKSMPKGKQDIDGYGVIFERVAKNIRAITVTDRELAFIVDDMVRNLGIVAKTFHDLSDAQKKVQSSVAKIEAVVPREKPIVDALNTFCGVAPKK